MTVWTVGISHRTARLDVRERLALQPLACDELVHALHSAGCAEAVALSTCNRTEVYFRTPTGPGDGPAAGADLLCAWAAERAPDVRSALYRHRGSGSVRHLFRVACGLDSLVPGERQIRVQVRDAYARSRTLQRSNENAPVLARMFEAALRAAGRVRRETRLNGDAASLPWAAVQHAARTLGSLQGRNALVLGAGWMSGVAARSLRALGIDGLDIASRVPERAAAVAQRCGAGVVGWQDMGAALARADVIVSVTTSPTAVLTRAMLSAAQAERGNAPQVVLDLGVPRDVEPDVRTMEGVILYDLDDLARIVHDPDPLQRGELAHAERIVAEEVDRYLGWVRTRRVVPVIRALRNRAEAVRRDELVRARGVLRELSVEQLQAVDAVTRRLLNKVLHTPTTRLRQAGANGRWEEVADLTRWLFSLEENGNGGPEGRDGVGLNGNGNGGKA
jgi:glutamyl-tRNA reductase